MRTTIVCTALAVLALGAAAAPADANTATQAQLEQITGIGPALAGRILDERRKRPFDDWRDLMGRVGGVGEGSAAKLSAAGLTVNGAGFRAAATGQKR